MIVSGSAIMKSNQPDKVIADLRTAVNDAIKKAAIK